METPSLQQGNNEEQANLVMTRFVRCNQTEANFVDTQNYQINAGENTLYASSYPMC